jgi:hypothetical protein
MISMKTSARRVFFGALFLGLIAALMITGCKGKGNAPAQAIEKPASSPEEITMDMAAAVLGKAEAENSGIFELGKRDEELRITYHFYRLHNRRGMEEFMGPDLAPKIQALYKKFPFIDRMFFEVDAFTRADGLQWKPYCTFVTTRKMIQETNWTDLLAKDFFKVVLDLKYAE